MQKEPIKVDIDFSKERKVALHLFLWVLLFVVIVVINVALVK